MGNRIFALPYGHNLQNAKRLKKCPKQIQARLLFQNPRLCDVERALQKSLAAALSLAAASVLWVSGSYFAHSYQAAVPLRTRG